MKLIDRLSRGIRVFRISADTREIADELRGIKQALFVICREQYNVELDPDRVIPVPEGAERAYADSGGADEYARVLSLMRQSGYEPPADSTDPIGMPADFHSSATFQNDARRPLLSVLTDTDDDELSGSDRIPTARRTPPDARGTGVRDSPDDDDPAGA